MSWNLMEYHWGSINGGKYIKISHSSTHTHFGTENEIKRTLFSFLNDYIMPSSIPSVSVFVHSFLIQSHQIYTSIRLNSCFSNVSLLFLFSSQNKQPMSRFLRWLKARSQNRSHLGDISGKSAPVVRYEMREKGIWKTNRLLWKITFFSV